MRADVSLTGVTVRRQLELLRRREISPSDLVAAALDRAEDTNTATSAFLTIARESALEAAGKVDVDTGPLAGIPVPIKDTEPTKGIRTTFGSALHAGNIPDADAASVANLKAAGAIVIGKTNTPAFGHLDTTENLLGPPARNPVRLSHTPGGSSGGAAAAVAAGVCSLAQCSDGAGSARIPASLCGIVGFKATYGEIPHWPTADIWAARTHQGVLGRTVDDVAFGMLAMATPTHQDPLCSSATTPWLGYREQNVTSDSMRGVYIAQMGSDQPDHEVAASCAAMVQKLIESGLKIDEMALDISDTHDWYSDLWLAPLAHMLAGDLDVRPELMEPTLQAAVRRGKEVSIARFLTARERRSQLHRSMVEALDNVSFIITPTLPTAGWRVGESPRVGGGGAPRHGDSGSRWENLYLFNILGWPAISVPCGLTAEGLPVGLQIATKRHEDLRCLKIAAMVEEIASITTLKWELQL